MKAASALLALAFVVGCSDSPESGSDAPDPPPLLDRGPLTVCAPEFERSETLASIALWGVEFGCDGQPELFVIYQDDLELPNGDFAGYISHNWIAISRDAVERGVPADLILAHEIGHALGFDHSDDPCDIMYSSSDWDAACIRASIDLDGVE